MAKINLPGYRTISTASTKVDGIYCMWVHKAGGEESVKKVKLLSRPDCPIRDMDDDDEYVFEVLESNTPEKFIKLTRNVAKPFYPVTQWIGKSGYLTTSRITMFEKE